MKRDKPIYLPLAFRKIHQLDADIVRPFDEHEADAGRRLVRSVKHRRAERGKSREIGIKILRFDGEVLEAVSALAPAGSRLEGLEPMKPKADQARARGLTIVEDYLRPEHPKVDFISVVDVFSHIPSFSSFLADVRRVLTPGGGIFVETGNLADLDRREEFPGELGLPDHLVFAGEKQLQGFLTQAGFEVLRVERQRIDGVVNLAKNVVKKLLGRPAALGVPYTSKYRSLLVRARLRE